MPYVAASAASTDPVEQVDANGDTVYYSMRRSWVGEPPKIAESDIAGEYSADVIVIGANYSGAPCFRMACEKGNTCIVIDSQAKDAFNSYGGELGHFNSEWQEKVLGVPKSTFDPTDFIDSYMLQCAGRAQPDLIRKFAQRNGEIVDWMMEVYEDISQVGSVCTIDQASNKYRRATSGPTRRPSSWAAATLLPPARSALRRSRRALKPLPPAAPSIR